MASFQTVLLSSLLFLAMAVGYSSAAWCVCKDGSDVALQKTLDWACGHGADCNPIKTTGACYNPSSLKAHCSYAVNSYYQRMSPSGATCDFSGAAGITTTDPSVSGCTYPASASAAGSSGTTTTVPSTTPTGTTPVTGTTTPISGTTPTTTTTSPYSSTTPTGVNTPTGVMGGIGSGLAPTGMDDTGNKAGMVKLDISTLGLCSALAWLVIHLWN